jgi:DNA-binding beta-propeller fold protein YncE
MHRRRRSTTTRGAASYAIALAIVLACAPPGFGQPTSSPATAPLTPQPFRFGAYQATLSNLAFPCAAAVDDDGLIYVADAGAHRIAVFSADGREVRSFGSLGSGEGQLHSPSAVAIGINHMVFVCDAGNDRIVVFQPDGTFVRSWGNRGTSSGEFCEPAGVALKGDRLYVADTGNHRVQVFRTDGTPVIAWGTFGRGDAQFNRPVDIALDDQGRVFVVDADNNRVQMFDHNGKFLAGWGDYGPFPGLLNDPQGIACRDGRAFVADTSNHRIQVFDDHGEMLRQWGIHDAMPHKGEGKIHYPQRVAFGGPSEHAFAVICEPNERRCQVFRAALVGEEEAPRVGIAPGELTHFGERIAISGRLMLIAEPESHFIFLFDLKEDGPVIISQFSQRGTKFGQFIRPTGMLASEHPSQAMIADASLARLQTFSLGFKPDEPLKFLPFMATFTRSIDFTHPRFAQPAPNMRWPLLPEAIARDLQGNLHVLDRRNAMVVVFDEQFRFVRAYGSFGSGAGQLRSPTDVAISTDGGLTFVVDAGNFRVQAFDRAGKAVMSIGSHGSGDGQFLQPFGVAVDHDGFVYVSDALGDCIQKFDAQGRFVKKWGTCGAEHGQFWRPAGVAIDDRQRLFVIDHGNHRAQMFTLEGEWLGTFGAGMSMLKSRMAD